MTASTSPLPMTLPGSGFQIDVDEIVDEVQHETIARRSLLAGQAF
jgi:hypothetical protein